MTRRSRLAGPAAALLGGLVLGPLAGAAPAPKQPEALALYPGADPRPKSEHVFTYPMADALAAARAVLQDAGFVVVAVPGSQTELHTSWKQGSGVGGGHGQGTVAQGVRVQAVAVSPTETVVRFFRLTRVKDDAVMARAPRRVDPGSRFAEGGTRPPSDLEHFNDESEKRYEQEERRAILGDQTFSAAGAAAFNGGMETPGDPTGGTGKSWNTKIEGKNVWDQETGELLSHDARFSSQGNMPTADDLRARHEKGVRDRELERELVRRLEQFPSLEFTGGAYDVAAGRAPAGAPNLAEAFAKEGGELPFSSKERCGVPVRGLGALGTAGSTLLVGEQAGTREVPAVVGNLACQLASQGPQVLLGLPIPREEQDALDAYLKSDGSRAAQDVLLARDFWRLAPRDGHSSRAMLVLLERVRAWRAGGLRIQPVAIDARNLRDNRREAAIAQLLLERRRRDPQAVLLVLAGNYHVRVQAGAAWSRSFQPFGVRLANEGVALTSLDTAFARGRRWTCTVNLRREPECRVYAAAPTAQSYSPPGLAPSVQLFDAETKAVSDEGYHGLLHVGALSASLPALPPRELLTAARRSSSSGPDEAGAPVPAYVAQAASGVAPTARDASGELSPVPEDEDGEEAPAPVTAAFDPARTPGSCGPELFGAQPLYKEGQLLLLGELQGSQETPALVAGLVCHAAARKLPVTLALELPRTEQKRINRFLSSAGRPEDRQRLLNGAFWNRPYQDGRSSSA
ncbi:MAG TPA: hypothetical protein VFO83_09710, partial [Aggregicoccus sp.]|nr:hypothetical protein [Aggregicoccus sp.]